MHGIRRSRCMIHAPGFLYAVFRKEEGQVVSSGWDLRGMAGFDTR